MKEKVIRTVKNKYFLVTTFTVVYMLFFDNYNFFFQMKQAQKIEDLQNDKLFYQKEIQKIKKERVLLMSNPEALETYAREEYWMKKDDEDLYIIVNPDENQFEERQK